MKRKAIIGLTLGTVAACLISAIGAVSYAYYERSVIIEGDSSERIPINVSEPRDTRLYLYPGYAKGWGGLLNVKNLYLACCFYKNDDSEYEWQLIKCNDHTGGQIDADASDDDHIFTYTVEYEDKADETFRMFRFNLDLTYYDRFIFLRVGSTVNLFNYMGIELTDLNGDGNIDNTDATLYENAPSFFSCTSNSENPIPLDWRNYDSSEDYKRYNATHRLTKPAGKNCYEIKATNSTGNYGFLSSGDWWDTKITE